MSCPHRNCQCSKKTVYQSKHLHCYQQCPSREEIPVIFVLVDQMIQFQFLPLHLQNEMIGFKKWKSKSIYFANHFISSAPCSPSRSAIYTGKNVNITKVTDNSNNTWQVSMPDVSTGLKTMGSYFKQKLYQTRYIGKVHFDKSMDRTAITRYKPTMATQDYMKKYDFDVFNKKGDFAYDIHGAFFSDPDVLSEKLPPGNDPNKCDYFDYETQEAYDGGIPYLTSKDMKREKNFFVAMNFENPHDITYANIDTDIPLSTTTFQLSGNPINTPDNLKFGVNAQYNKNYRKYYDEPLIFKKSFDLDNNFDSTTNQDSLNLSIVNILLATYYMYGIRYNNESQAQAYQTNYLQQMKQIDAELNELYDFLESKDYFNKAVIVLSSDHGEYCAAHGLYQKTAIIYKEAWNTILFISYPHMPCEYKGYVYQNITSHVQLLPTIMTLSNQYNSSQIAQLGLFPSIFNDLKQLRYVDFQNIKLGLATGYGPVVVPLLRSVEDTNAELKNYLDTKLPPFINYFTLQGYSVSTNVRINQKLYNVGIYFSLLHTFVDTIQRIKNNVTQINTIRDRLKQLKEYNLSFNEDDIVILRNSLNERGVAIVGKYSDIKVEFFSSNFSRLYFSNPIVELFDPSVSEYQYVADNPIYRNQIYSNSILFNVSNVFTLQPPPPPLPSSPYTIIDQDPSGAPYIYVGDQDYINFLFNTNPVIQNTFINPMIMTGYPSSYGVYICNDPIYQKAQIYVQNESKITETISAISNLTETILSLISYNPIQVYLFFKVNMVYDNYNSLAFFFNQLISNFIQFGFLSMPGRDKNITQLLLEEFQVQVFNTSDDPDELYNLADSSRVATYQSIVNQCLVALNSNILYNHCENIYIALPIDIAIQQTFDKLRDYTKSNVPQIYNYRILTENLYNKMN
jgi:arylsulfatase A-like enzyme